MKNGCKNISQVFFCLIFSKNCLSPLWAWSTADAPCYVILHIEIRKRFLGCSIGTGENLILFIIKFWKIYSLVPTLDSYILDAYSLSFLHILLHEVWDKTKVVSFLIVSPLLIQEHIGYTDIYILSAHLIGLDSHILGIKICIRGYYDIKVFTFLEGNADIQD